MQEQKDLRLGCSMISPLSDGNAQSMPDSLGLDSTEDHAEGKVVKDEPHALFHASNPFQTDTARAVRTANIHHCSQPSSSKTTEARSFHCGSLPTKPLRTLLKAGRSPASSKASPKVSTESVHSSRIACKAHI